MTERNSAAATLAGTFVRTFERCSLRGAPTILKQLSKIPGLRRTMASTRLSGGETIVFPAFDAYWCRFIWANAPYERDVEHIFRMLGQGRALIDAGANIGYWSVRAREFGFVEVIAIEANRELIPILEANFSLNAIPGRVHHAAVYSISGEKLFLDHTEAHAQAGIGERGMPVTSITIADAVKHVPPQQEIVVKLDVEGAEIPALEGAGQVERAIFVYEDFLRHDMVVSRYLLEHGFAIFGVTSAGESKCLTTAQEASAFAAATAAPGGPSNLIACRRNQAEGLRRELAAPR